MSEKETGRGRRAFVVLVVLCSVAGAGLILAAASRYGPGINEDGVSYVAAARGLIAGRGLVDYDGSPFTRWPPLYPAVLAAASLGRGDPLASVVVVNAVLFALIILLSGLYLAGRVASPTFRFIGLAAVCLSVPVMEVSVRTLSEPLFILCALLALVLLERFVERRGASALLLAGAAAALACLTRYLGVTVVLAGAAALLLDSSTGFVRRVRNVAAFALIAVIPPAAWLLRNALSGEGLAGGGPTLHALPESVFSVLDTLSVWVFPRAVPPLARVVLMIAVAAIAAAGYVKARRAQDGARPLPRTMPAFVATYLVGLLAATCTVGSGVINFRLLSPVYVPLALIGILVVQALPGAFATETARRRAAVVLAVAAALWVCYPAARTAGYVADYLDRGVGEFATAEWRESPLIGYLREHPLDGALQSNCPEAVYLFLGRPAHLGPRKRYPTSAIPTDDVSKLRQLLAERGATHYVWFRKYEFRSYLYSIDDLRREFAVEPVSRLEDGTVYRLSLSE